MVQNVEELRTNSKFKRSVILVFLINPLSQLNRFGPKSELRAKLPNVKTCGPA